MSEEQICTIPVNKFIVETIIKFPANKKINFYEKFNYKQCGQKKSKKFKD